MGDFVEELNFDVLVIGGGLAVHKCDQSCTAWIESRPC